MPSDPLLDVFGITQIAHWDRVTNKPRLVTRARSARGARAQLLSGGVSQPLPLTVGEVGPDCMEITLPTVHNAGLVVLADTAYPGWGVQVDGKASETVMVNGAFRGVSVGKSACCVQWRYEPSAWRLGMFISLFSVGIIAAVSVPILVARRRGETR